MQTETAPFTHSVPVTPNDAADLPNGVIARSLYIGGAGDVKFTTYDGDTDTHQAVPAGTYLPGYIKRVWAGGTTATNIHAVW